MPRYAVNRNWGCIPGKPRIIILKMKKLGRGGVQDERRAVRVAPS